ncbi:hypothetical protein C8J56DRAFT_886329 [Mycena floridula]|nr:hypothetical protein C8J56DRAFT_886329 [Mycena floridula]
MAVARELLNSFRMAGVTILGPSDGSDSRNSVNVSIRLSVQSPLMERTRNAATLLIIISMLPSGTTSRHLRKYWAVSLSNLPAALQALLDTSLLECRSKTYFVHPVIRSYILERSPVPKDIIRLLVQGAYKFLKTHNSNLGQPSYKEHMLARCAIEINLQTILLSTTDSQSDIIRAHWSLAWHQYQTRPRLEIIEHAVKLAADISDHTLKGRVSHCYAVMLYNMARDQDALEQYKLARKSFIHAGDTEKAALMLLRIAYISVMIDPEFDEIPLIKKAQIELTLRDKPIVLQLIRRFGFLYPLFLTKRSIANQDILRCLAELGEAYSRSRDYSKAIKCLIRARDTCSAGSVDAAHYAEELAVTHYRLENYEEAERRALVACKEWKQLGGSTSYSLWILGITYITKHEYDKAIESLTEGLEAAKVRVAVSWIADSLLELGRAYMKKGDIATARNMFVEALNEYQTLQGRDEEIICARFYLESLENPNRLPDVQEKKALRVTWHEEDAT